MKTLAEVTKTHEIIGQINGGQGIRTTAKNTGKTKIFGDAAHKAAQSDAMPNNQAHFDQRLNAVIDRWPTLSESERNRIAKIVGGAK